MLLQEQIHSLKIEKKDKNKNDRTAFNLKLNSNYTRKLGE